MTTKITIGLPIYNGEKYLSEALDSLLAQSYQDYIIVIYDNGSNDATEEICRAYAQQDDRISYVRHERNRGTVVNFNELVYQTTTEYFMWAACDDLWSPNYIEKCLAQLEKHPTAVMCQSDIQYMDKDGHITSVTSHFMDTTDLTVMERMEECLRFRSWIIYGLYRTEQLKKTRILTEIYGADIVLGVEVLLLGDVVKAEEVYLSYRVQPKTTEEYIQLFSVDEKTRETMRKGPATALAQEIYAVLMASSRSPQEKRQLTQRLLQTIAVDKTFLYGQIIMEQQVTLHMAPFLLEDQYLFFQQLISSGTVNSEAACETFQEKLKKLVSDRALWIWVDGLERYRWNKILTHQNMTITGWIAEQSILGDSSIISIEDWERKKEDAFLLLSSTVYEKVRPILAEKALAQGIDYAVIGEEQSFLYIH
ncbi:glycosyl transferase family protein [Fictibacillus macauensis ZFHKF-1]|uniref:Glycosyl transferase family protein n=1 Tax=Fictibacillus macauensis ZFHKF-1 TaxID=1196324 RepID=I8UCG9_9BACL|nr:glycosyltransferase family A protein [Fictibacillus macauensis]EIT84620.1 glycosyl transferase family protein [Fictibacillus macauensis ZFHKF-1]